MQQRALLLALWRSPLQCPVIGIESLLVLLPPEQAVALVLQFRQLQRALRLGTATQLDSADMSVTPWPRLLPGSVRTIDSSAALASLGTCSAPRLLCQASRASSERTLPHQALAVTYDTANTLSGGKGLEVLNSASAQATAIPVCAGTRPELADGALPARALPDPGRAVPRQLEVQALDSWTSPARPPWPCLLQPRAPLAGTRLQIQHHSSHSTQHTNKRWSSLGGPPWPHY